MKLWIIRGKLEKSATLGEVYEQAKLEFYKVHLVGVDVQQAVGTAESWEISHYIIFFLLKFTG